MARASRTVFDLQHVPVEYLTFSNDSDSSGIISTSNVEDRPGFVISDPIFLSRRDEVEVRIGSVSCLISVVGLMQARNLVETALLKLNLDRNIAEFVDVHVQKEDVPEIVRLDMSIPDLLLMIGRGTDARYPLIISRRD